MKRNSENHCEITAQSRRDNISIDRRMEKWRAGVNGIKDMQLLCNKMSIITAQMKSHFALPRRLREVREVARAAGLIERYYKAGYTTFQLFANAVRAVYPHRTEDELVFYYDMVSNNCDWFLSDDIEDALETLKPGK